MTSLASADRQLASMAADKPTATACCAIVLMMRLGSLETGTSGVSAQQTAVTFEGQIQLEGQVQSKRAEQCADLGLFACA